MRCSPPGPGSATTGGRGRSTGRRGGRRPPGVCRPTPPAGGSCPGWASTPPPRSLPSASPNGRRRWTGMRAGSSPGCTRSPASSAVRPSSAARGGGPRGSWPPPTARRGSGTRRSWSSARWSAPRSHRGAGAARCAGDAAPGRGMRSPGFRGGRPRPGRSRCGSPRASSSTTGAGCWSSAAGRRRCAGSTNCRGASAGKGSPPRTPWFGERGSGTGSPWRRAGRSRRSATP